jgi:DNA polymerase III sliding clamp (beta) subunit (PCNA family)
MTVNRQELVSALESAGRIVGNSRGESPCYYFTGEAIEATDMLSFISVPFKTDFVCAVTVKNLLPFLKTLTSETVDISCTTDKPYLRVSFGKMVSNFATSAVEIPWPQADEFKELPVPSDLFTVATNRCRQYVSTDTTRVLLTGVNISTKDGVMYATATDGRRLYNANMGKVDTEYNFTIIPLLLRLIANEEVEEFSISGNTISFRCKSGALYAGRVLEGGRYPNWAQVIPKDRSNHTKVVFPDELKGHLHRVILLGATSVTLAITADLCTISADAEYSSYTEEVAVSSDGEVTVKFDPRLLSQLVSVSTTLQLEATGPAIAEANGAISLLMPLRQN